MTDRPLETVHGLLDRRAGQSGEAPFLSFDDRHWSFAEFARATRQVAAGLAATGIGHGDKVAIMLSNRPEFLLSWFALSRLGAVEVPVNTAHRGTLLHYILAQAECSTLIVEPAFLGQVADVAGDLPLLRTLIVVDADGSDWPLPVVPFAALENSLPLPDPVAVSGSDAMAIIFTSGTTGPSKGVVLPQAYALRQAEIIVDACAYTAADCLYNALPLFHGNAQFLSTMPALAAGARMVLARKFSASAFWADVRRHGCTEFNYIGGILPILMKAEPSPDDAGNGLRLMMGAGCPADMFDGFERRFGLKLVEGYGMSEIGIPFINRIDDRKAGSCGRAGDTHDAMIVDDDGAELPDGQAGELLIRPRHRNGMMTEYYRMPEATVAAWRDLWFHTGDALRRDGDGRYYFVDRKKDALRRRGENISSHEVERGVAQHPAVLEAAAVAVASELGEDEVMVCLTLRDGQSLAPIDLLGHCIRDMALFMVPRYIRILDALPKTPTERVQKYALRMAGVTPDTYDREGDPRWPALLARAKAQ